MREVVYDLEEFERLVDREKRIHFDASTECPHGPHDISAIVTLVMEGISKEGAIIRHEKFRPITFEETMKHGDELRKSGKKHSTNAYDHLNDLVIKAINEWKKECQEKYNATPGRYDEVRTNEGIDGI